MKRIIFVVLVFAGLGLWLLQTKSKPSPSSAPVTTPKKSIDKKFLPYLPSRQDAPIQAEEAHGSLRVEGQVLDPEGNAAEGAEVVISTTPPRSAKTDPRGWFFIDGLAPRTYWLSASEGDASTSQQYAAAEDALPVTLRLIKREEVIVFVEDANTQEPIAGAEVHAGWSLEQKVITDQAGRAKVRGEEYGSPFLRVSAPGYATFSGQGEQAIRDKERCRIIHLTEGFYAAGVVLDASGSPLAGATVEIADGPGSLVDWRGVTSGADGKWRADGLAPGSYRFRARHPSFAPALSSVVNLSRSTGDVTIQLGEGASISGKVIQPDGTPVAGAIVFAQQSEQVLSYSEAASAYTDQDGQFTVRGLAPISHTVLAQSSGASSTIAKVNLKETKNAKDLTLILDQDGTLSGVVLDAAGQPAPEAKVSATAEQETDEPIGWGLQSAFSAVTDQDGRFMITGLPFDTRFSLYASTERGESDRTKAKTGDAAITIKLSSFASARGRVQFEDGSSPKTFTAQTLGQSCELRYEEAPGSFVLEKLSVGALDFEISGGEFVSYRAPEGITVAEGEQKDLGVIVVKRGRTVRGLVLAEDKSPVAGATVSVAAYLYIEQGRASAQGMRTAYTKQDGSFLIAGLSEEQLLIVATHPEKGVSDVGEINKEQTQIDLNLRLTGELRGVARYKGRPTEAFISLYPEEALVSTSFNANSLEDGVFQLSAIPPGKYMLLASRAAKLNGIIQSGKPITRSIEIMPQKKTELEIDLPEGTNLIITVMRGKEAISNVKAVLLPGAVNYTDSTQLANALHKLPQDSYWQGQSIDAMVTTSKDIVLADITPGAYTLCFSTFSLSLTDTKTAKFVEDKAVSCAPITIDHVETQTVTREL